jgi:hypothetical protein
MNYPHLHHLGFKLLCVWMFYQSLTYMDLSITQREQQTRYLRTISENTSKHTNY